MSFEARLDGTHEEGLRGTLAIFRRRWLVMVAIVVACVAVAVIHSARSAKVYKATANVTFQSGTLSDAALQISPSTNGEPQREANTEVLIAHSPEVARGVIAQMKSTASANEVLEQVQVEVAPTANVLNIVASSGNPAFAANLANVFAEQYIAFRTSSELAGISSAQSKLEKQIESLPAGSPERATLAQSVQRLAELRAIAGGGATVIGRASTPKNPSGTTTTTFAIIGLLVGIATAVLVVLLLEALDRRVRSTDDLEREYGLPALAAIPQSAFRAQRADARGEALEPYRMLRSALEFTAAAREAKMVLVTSATSGEGKTTVAIDLAHAIALTGRRTALVEMDLRRPSFGKQFDLGPSHGISSVLIGRTTLEESLQSPVADAPDLHVLPAGRLPHNPAEILGSDRVADILRQLAGSSDMVIIDAPPLNLVADTQVLLNNEAIGGVIVVARVNVSKRDEIRRARAILDQHAVKPIGLVITGLRNAGAYGAGYGEYRAAADEEPDAAGEARKRPRRRTTRQRLPL